MPDIMTDATPGVASDPITTPSAPPATVADPAPVSTAPPVAQPGQSGGPTPGEPPRERWDAILRSAREKTRDEVAAEYQARYGKYDLFEQDPWKAVQTWLSQASQHSLYGPLVRQWAGQYTQGDTLQAEEPKADVPIVDASGQVTGQTYSDTQLKAWHRWNAARQQADLDARLAPLESYRADATAREHEQQLMHEATAHATATLSALRRQPYFEAHEPAIRQALMDHEEWGDNVHAAYNHVLVTEILPKLSQAEQQKVINDLHAKGQATTVAPGGTAPARPSFKSFRAAAEYYAAHPDEAERMATR